MNTTVIGRGFEPNSFRLRCACTIGLGVVLADLLLTACQTMNWVDGLEWTFSYWRIGLGVVTGVALLVLAGDRGESIGLRRRADPGWGYWPRVSLQLGGIVLAFAAIVILVGWSLGYIRPEMFKSMFQSESDIWYRARLSCLHAPLCEELLYRLALCVPLVLLLGRKGAIVAGGAVFTALHFVYGNPGADNCIAGFLLTWAYLKSGNLWVPIALHALGNLFVVGVHAFLFYVPIVD